MALKYQALFLSFAPFLRSRQSHNIPFLQDSITWVWQRKKNSTFVFHEENRVFLLNYNCSFLLLCARILERDFYTFPEALDTSKTKYDAENRITFQIKIFQEKSINFYVLTALGYLMTFRVGGIPTGMTVLHKGSRVQTCLPAQGAKGKQL